MNDDQLMRIAIEEAKLTKGPKRFGAIVVKDGKIVAKAHATAVEKEDPTKHAEIQAISKAAKYLLTRRLDDCILFSTCEPCMMCTGAALWARINKVVYAMSRNDALKHFDDSSLWHLEIKKIVPKNFIIKEGVLKEEALKIFTS